MDSIDRLPKAVSGSRLPAELRDEINGNLRVVIRQLASVDEADDPTARSVLANVFRHMAQLAERLEEGSWLTNDNNLSYMLRETVEGLERVVYRGDLREFRS
jgi:hypothetical protein